MPRLSPLRALLVAALVAGAAGCDLDITNPNAASEDAVLGTPEGVRALAVGLQEYYATTALTSNVLVPAVSGREAAITTTFANLIELEAGGTNLPTNNASVLQLWSRNYRAVGIAEQLIEQADAVTLEPGTQSGIQALARLYKALALGTLAQNFEQAPLTTDRDAPPAFVPRQQVFEEAVRLLEEAQGLLGATPASDAFRSGVLAPGFDLPNTIGALLARYRLFAGDYAGALAAADAVDAGATSVFPYDDQSQNPIWNQIVDDEDYAPRDLFGTLLTDPDDERLDFWMDTTAVLSDPNGFPVNAVGGFFGAAVEAIPAYLPGELPLIRAEAHLRLGDLDAAVAEINAVRTKAPTDDPLGVGAALGPYDGPLTEPALLDELFQQRRAELFLQGFGLEDARRLDQPGPDPGDPFARSRNFYPYPEQERLNNPNTPGDPEI